MLRVGLTGGIGSGKSTVAQLFGVLGVPVFQADEQAKALMAGDAEVRAAIASRFPNAFEPDGELDRKALAAVVFHDEHALAELNAIVHPAVRRAFDRWTSGSTEPYLVMEAALMAENGGYRQFDRVVTVTCPEAIRIRRVMERDGTGEEEVRARMRNQAAETDRVRIAHYLVNNDGTELVIPQVLAIHADLLTLAG